MRKIMTEKKDTNDFDNLDDLFSGDFDFVFEDETQSDHLQKTVIIHKQNSINEQEVERRAAAQAAFLQELEARKKEKEDERLKELEPVIDFVRSYHERIGQMEWFENVVMKDFLDSYPDGSKKVGDIIYRLASDLQSIAYNAAENNHDHKIHGQDMWDIKALAIFIIELAEGRL